jgi:mitochondrial fission protein ELM1
MVQKMSSQNIIKERLQALREQALKKVMQSGGSSGIKNDFMVGDPSKALHFNGDRGIKVATALNNDHAQGGVLISSSVESSEEISPREVE